jgi:hypothetical protein
MIVMGIYRLLDVLIRHDPTVTVNQITAGHKRIVICYPPYNYHMDPSDMVCEVLGLIEKIEVLFCRFMLCSNHVRIIINIHEKTPHHYRKFDNHFMHNN